MLGLYILIGILCMGAVAYYRDTAEGDESGWQYLVLLLLWPLCLVVGLYKQLKE